MSADRLQKILARAGVTSRRKAEALIEAGQVTVNGRIATLGDKADPERDSIKLDGKRILLPAEHRYLLVNKPRAVMSTVSDPEGRPTVLDLVPPGLRKALVPVGRLDFLTEGLLLLTDDGDLAQRVAHPRYGCSKTYEVKVRGEPPERDLDKLRRGFVLQGRRLSPVTIERRRVAGASRGSESNSWWRVELGEGRNRQIREMFQRIGHPVMKLRRVAVGPLTDPDLPPGGVRELQPREVEALRRATRGGKGSGSSPGSGGGGKKGGPSRGKSGGGSAGASRGKTGGPPRGKSGGPPRGKGGGKSGGGKSGGGRAAGRSGGPPRSKGGGKSGGGRGGGRAGR